MSETKSNEYQPTNAELKLLDALHNPENYLLSITELCNVAGISRKTYYECFKKPEFCALNQEMGAELVKKVIQPIINASAKAAIDGSYQHAKMLLEMAGSYIPTSKQQISSPPGESLNISQQLTDAELDAKIKQIITDK